MRGGVYTPAMPDGVCIRLRRGGGGQCGDVESFCVSQTNKQTNRQTDRQMEGQTDRQTLGNLIITFPKMRLARRLRHFVVKPTG